MNVGTDSVLSRGVASTWNSLERPGMGNGHRVRPLILGEDYARFDPFLVLMEDWFGPHVFEDHPHRGMETVTYVIDGELDHRQGGRATGRFATGDAMWMTAGRGVIHNEAPASGKTVHTLQLWVNLPAAEKMAEPRFQILHGVDAPVRREPGAAVKVFSGESGGVRAATLNHVPVTMVEIALEPGASFVQDLPASHNGFLHLLSGSGRFGRDSVPAQAGEMVLLDPPVGPGESTLAVTSGPQGLRALLWAGEPLHEPVVARGPFVMNSEAQIRQAYADYRAGRF